MDNIIQSIYKSCDENNTDFVLVSSLIEFIKPYMQNNLNELVKLQIQLDPDNTDPCIDYVSFQRVMSDWIAAMQADDINNSLSEFPVNLSLDASCDNKLNNNNGVRSVILEEEVQNLKYQLNKVTSELDLAKKQLATCEEQNESLLADINSRCQQQNKEQCLNERHFESQLQNEELDEGRNVDNKKYEQMERMLSNYGREQEKYLKQINQLENENLHLKNRLQTYEKMKRESRKSASDLQDCLDLKESEIVTLMEINENLKCELEEKVDLLNFYTNEHKLFKQKIKDLEKLLQKSTPCYNISNSQDVNFKSVFNTPKLLNQLANPVTPALQTPVKQFRTSSPLKNASSESGNGSGFDLFSNTSAVTKLRSPHKTLKDEMAEISNERSQETDEVENLYKVVRDQDEFKNNLWQKLKQLSDDNEALLHYKKEYFELMFKIKEKDELLEYMKNKLGTLKQQQKDHGQQFEMLEETENLMKHLTLGLTKVQDNLKEQKSIGWNLQGGFEQLSDQLEIMKASLYKERTLNRKLTKSSCEMINRSTQTDGNEISWNLERVCPESKKGNFVKQQMKIDRLMEKQEKLERDLSNERSINTKLALRCQEMGIEKENIKNKLEYCQKRTSEQVGLLNESVSEKNDLLKKLGVLEVENGNLNVEVADLARVKRDLDENLRNMSNKLTEQMTLCNNFRLENELLMNKQYTLEAKMKNEFAHQFNLKKQLMDSGTIIGQLQDELVEKRNESKMLKKQIEVLNFDSFMSCNEELRRVIINASDCLKFDDDWHGGLINTRKYSKNDKSLLVLVNEMNDLKANIKLVVLLLQKICDEHLNTRFEVYDDTNSNWDDEASVENEESFASCSSELVFESGSFLENLSSEHVDFKNLSRKEMEERFATLALLLTVDVTTLKKRIVNEKEKFDQLAVKFFTFLNHSVDLLKTSNSLKKNKIFKSVRESLKLVKDVSEDMFRAAFECGVLRYEKNTADCWKLVINYVAILSRENKMKEIKTICKKNLETQTCPVFREVITDNLFPSMRLWYLRIKFWICTFVVLLVFFVITLIFYVDHLCPKNGKRMCPLQWISGLFVEKTYSSNFHL